MHGDSSPKCCECGCGKPAPIATATNRKRGYKKGYPKRFILGHATRGVPKTAEWRAQMSERMAGSENPSWRGGRADLHGYVRVKVGREHSMAASDGYALEHRLVAAETLGRMLRPDEVVHHIDRNRSNNAPDNLLILSQSQHLRLHHLIEAGMDLAEAARAVAT